MLQFDAYNLVNKMLAEQQGEAYLFDRENLTALGFPAMERENRDSTGFRNYWLYMPQFRVLDQNDFVTTMAVFLMLFVFIALICFAAVIVISFTRCMTIALTSTRVYGDLRHLGAPNQYLFRSVKEQVSRVFLVPAVVGTAVIFAFYTMILYFNDSRFTPGELAGMGACAAVMSVLSCVLYGVYRFTRKSVCRSLGIRQTGATHKRGRMLRHSSPLFVFLALFYGSRLHSSLMVSDTAILQTLFPGMRGTKSAVHTSSSKIPPTDVQGSCHAVPPVFSAQRTARPSGSCHLPQKRSVSSVVSSQRAFQSVLVHYRAFEDSLQIK